MKRSLLIVACLAIASAFAACWRPTCEMAVAVYRTYKRAKDWLVDTIAYGFKLAARDADGFARLAVPLIQAKAFVMRLAKRERPELTGSWRMCPST